MEKKYPAMNMVSSLLKTVSIAVVLVGVGGSIWVVFQAKELLGAMNQWAILIAVISILVAVVTGVLLYALGDLFRCLIDIESNTRKTVRSNGNGNGNSSSNGELKIKPVVREKKERVLAVPLARGNGSH